MESDGIEWDQAWSVNVGIVLVLSELWNITFIVISLAFNILWPKALYNIQPWLTLEVSYPLNMILKLKW